VPPTPVSRASPASLGDPEVLPRRIWRDSLHAREQPDPRRKETHAATKIRKSPSTPTATGDRRPRYDRSQREPTVSRHALDVAALPSVGPLLPARAPLSGRSQIDPQAKNLAVVVELRVDRIHIITSGGRRHDRTLNLNRACSFDPVRVLPVEHLLDNVLPSRIGGRASSHEVARVADDNDAGVNANLPHQSLARHPREGISLRFRSWPRFGRLAALDDCGSLRAKTGANRWLIARKGDPRRMPAPNHVGKNSVGKERRSKTVRSGPEVAGQSRGMATAERSGKNVDGTRAAARRRIGPSQTRQHVVHRGQFRFRLGGAEPWSPCYRSTE